MLLQLCPKSQLTSSIRTNMNEQHVDTAMAHGRGMLNLRYSLAILPLICGMACSADGSESADGISHEELVAMVDEHVDGLLPSAGHRTIEEFVQERNSESDSPTRDHDLSSEERLMRLSVKILLNEGAHTRSDEFVLLENEILSLFWDRVLECARPLASGIEKADLERASPWDYGIDRDPEYEARAQQLGLNSAELVDLRFRCSRLALSPSDPSDELETLLRRMREIQMAAAETWLSGYSNIPSSLNGR